VPRRLSISIRPDGSITAEASGTPGPECLDALDQLRTILRAEVEGSKPTPEFSMSVTSVAVDVRDSHYQEDQA
jgi:hypothetical protein